MRHLKAVNDKAKRIEHLVEVAEATRRDGEVVALQDQRCAAAQKDWRKIDLVFP